MDRNRERYRDRDRDRVRHRDKDRDRDIVGSGEHIGHVFLKVATQGFLIEIEQTLGQFVFLSTTCFQHDS